MYFVLQATANVAAVTGAKDKTSTLSGASGRRGMHLEKRAITDCAGVIAANVKIVGACSDSPTSSSLETAAKEVSAVADSLACTDDEKATLTTHVALLTAGAAKVQEAADALNKDVEVRQSVKCLKYFTHVFFRKLEELWQQNVQDGTELSGSS